jgi:hypothetical protein
MNLDDQVERKMVTSRTVQSGIGVTVVRFVIVMSCHAELGLSACC